MKQLQKSNTGSLALTTTPAVAVVKPMLTTPEYDALQARKMALAEELYKIQVTLYDKSTTDALALLNSLQLQKAAHEGAIEAAEAALARINPELDKFDCGVEKSLLEAISGQRWWLFRDKKEIAYDSRTGVLFPNFEHVALESWSTWSTRSESYELSGEGRGKWHVDYGGYINSGRLFNALLASAFQTLPNKKFRIRTDIIFYLAYKGENSSHYEAHYYSNALASVSSKRDPAIIGFALPFCGIYSNKCLTPDDPTHTALEKAQMVLDFFVQRGWQPVLDKPELQPVLDALIQRPKLQAQLIELEKQIAELPAPEIKTTFTSAFDYTQPLREYDVAAANQSVWQYTHSAKRWLGYLLAQLDDWSRENQSLLDCAHRINSQLTQKLPLGKDLTDDEKTLLQQRRLALQTRLNFNLEPLRAALIRFNGQLETLEKDLHQLNRADDSLQQLAQVARQARPPLELLAEHTATLCTETLKGLEWLGERQEFVRHLVAAENERAEQYAVFVDKFQPDLYTQAADNSIDRPEVDVWFGEWRRERRQMEAQWLPLVDAGLDKTLDTQTVLAALEILTVYQQQLDKFYLQDRHGIHTKFAFEPNGHRQEKLEKELELAKLTHQFMEQLQKHIFATETTAQKVWLVRWAEVWQRDNTDEVLRFLEGEQLIERGEISQLVLTEMRQLQQRTLEACLQDAKAYSEALKKRETDYNALIFKMRKELQKGK